MAYVGAPWIDGSRYLEAVRGYGLPGVEFEAVSFVPRGEGWVPFRGENVNALRIRVTDRDSYPAVLTALVLAHEARRLHPQHFRITNEGFTQMIGSRWARQAFDRGEDPREINRRWEEENARWEAVRARYRLYP
jgi:uncharacterized protein YbbC (DUF1343 family)